MWWGQHSVLPSGCPQVGDCAALLEVDRRGSDSTPGLFQGHGAYETCSGPYCVNPLCSRTEWSFNKRLVYQNGWNREKEPRATESELIHLLVHTLVCGTFFLFFFCFWDSITLSPDISPTSASPVLRLQVWATMSSFASSSDLSGALSCSVKCTVLSAWLIHFNSPSCSLKVVPIIKIYDQET